MISNIYTRDNKRYDLKYLQKLEITGPRISGKENFEIRVGTNITTFIKINSHSLDIFIHDEKKNGAF